MKSFTSVSTYGPHIPFQQSKDAYFTTETFYLKFPKFVSLNNIACFACTCGYISIEANHQDITIFGHGRSRILSTP